MNTRFSLKAETNRQIESSLRYIWSYVLYHIWQRGKRSSLATPL